MGVWLLVSLFGLSSAFPIKDLNQYDRPPLHFQQSEELSQLRHRLNTYLEREDKEPMMNTRPVDRYQPDELSLKDFYEKYANPGIPVVIENYNFTTAPWTLQRFRDVCGDAKCTPYQSAAKLTGWGKLLRSHGQMPLRQFIDNFGTNYTRTDVDTQNGISPPYVFDWSLPWYCPEITKEFIVPKYFAQDFFQRNTKGLTPGNTNAWPSLFIGSEGCQSSMHIDSGGTNFWMGQLEGKKQWRIFPPWELDYLYFSRFDDTFAIDPMNPDFEQFPLLKHTNPWDTVIGPGDVLFIPATAPHKVISLTPTVSISMNYIDSSNMNISRVGMYMRTALEDTHFANSLSHSAFPSDVSYDIDDVPYDRFKDAPQWPGDGIPVLNDLQLLQLYELWRTQTPILLWEWFPDMGVLIEPHMWEYIEKDLPSGTKVFKVDCTSKADTLLTQHVLGKRTWTTLFKWKDGNSYMLNLHEDKLRQKGFTTDVIRFFMSAEKSVVKPLHWDDWWIWPTYQMLSMCHAVGLGPMFQVLMLAVYINPELSFSVVVLSWLVLRICCSNVWKFSFKKKPKCPATALQPSPTQPPTSNTRNATRRRK